jgi:arsenate reductase
MFSNTFAGIAPASVPGYIAAQLIGGTCAILAIRTLYPDLTPDEAAEAVMPHHLEQPSAISTAASFAARE